jgi:hypothetical protein
MDPEEKAKIEEHKKTIRPLRTYEGDVSSFVKNNKISTANIVIEEQKRKQNLQNAQATNKTAVEEAPITETTTTGPNFFQKIPRNLLISIGLIAVSIAIIVLVTIFFNPLDAIKDGINNLTNNDDPQDVLIDKEDETKISSENKINLEIKAEIIDAIKDADTLGNGEILEIRVTEGGESVPISRLLEILEMTPPDKMARALSNDYLIGMIGVSGDIVPFILLGTEEFDQVFATILGWEGYMYRQVNDFFFKELGINDFLENNLNDQKGFSPTDFKDIVVANRDARALIRNNGETAFFYTFVNSRYLLLTTDTRIVASMAQKLNLQNLIR